MAKLYDLAVKTRNYTNSQGEEKAVWKTVGSILETKNGGKVILLDRTFNPAGCPSEDGRDTIMISMFEPKEKAQDAHSEAKSNAYQKQSADEDIPF
jgi:hypothetical protein